MDDYNSISENIDVRAILCEIRKNIKETGLSQNVLAFEDNFDEKFLSLIPTYDDIEQKLEFLYNSWNIQPNKPLYGNRLIVFVKKVIRKMIRFFIIPIVNEQNVFNRSVLHILKRNCELRKEINILKDQIMQLKKEVKKLPIDYNIELLFKQGSFAINYLEKGFSDPEDSLTWTDQETAEINIPISITETDLKLIIKGHKLTPSQTIEIIINNCSYGNIENSNNEFCIKASSMAEYNYLNIKLNISKPFAPKELGISDDIRTLGYALIAVGLYKCN
jgi:hypothetical protein